MLEILRLTKTMRDPVDIIAELESEDVHREKKAEAGKKDHHKDHRRGGQKRR